MNRRFGAVAIVLMALTALAGVFSFVFFSQPVPKHSGTAPTAVTDSSSIPSTTTSSTSTGFTPSPAPVPQTNLRPDQPPEFQPVAHPKEPSWKLLDWSVKPFPGKPGIELRASSWAAPGKHSFVRLEEEVKKDASGNLVVLHRKEMVGDQIIVKLPEGATQQDAEAMATKIGGRAGSRPFAPDTWLFKLDRKLEAVPEGMENLKSSGAVIDYTEPDLIVRPARLPNDPKVTDFTSWHLYNNTQLDKDIRATKAWDRRTSAAYGTTNKVIVAVLDSGVRYSHQDLSDNMWRNPGEIAGDGIDNDNNDWKDDVYGIDAYDSEDWEDKDYDARKDNNEGFLNISLSDTNGNGIVDLDSDPMDQDGHGTHCAGIIGAVGNNGIGLAGVAWDGVEIMALRFINGTGSISDEVLCMDYARFRGAKVINASFGQDGGQSPTEIAAITRLNASGVILVAAAGNGGSDYVGDNNNGAKPFYPASYTNGNIISVGATDRNDNKTGFSNFGATAVDLFAPGHNIYSTRTGTDTSYGPDNGTSFAAPMVSGALALLIAEYPNDTVSQRVARVVNTNAVDVIPALSGLCVTGGRLNLAKLLPANTNPLAIANAWHLPFNQETQISSTMRSPTSNVTTTSSITIHSGIQKFNNPDFGMANQVGGAVLYRTSASTAWITNNFRTSPVVNSGNNQYWSSVVSNLPAATYQYVLRLDFDSGAQTTFVYAQTQSNSTTTTNLTNALASPFSFTVSKASATVTLSGTNQTYNGSVRPVSVTTSPSGLATTVTYNGSSSAPTDAGTYTVVATVSDSNYDGSATSILTITKAPATLSLGNLSQTYSGSARTVSVSTTPSSLANTVTYNGSASAPTNAGTYTVVATITDSNYQGSVTNTLTVAKATSTILSGPTASAITFGQTLASSSLTGGSATPPGTFSFTTLGTTPSAGVSTHGVTFTPADTGNYLNATSTVNVTVNKAPTTVSTAPSASSIRLGQTLAYSSLSGGLASVPGNFSFSSPATAPSLGTSAQPVTFTPADSANYLAAATSALVHVAGVENPTGDADGDGTPNLLEHALAEFSNNAGSLGSTAEITAQSAEVGDQTTTTLTLTAVVRTNDPSLTVIPEASLHLGSSPWVPYVGFTTNVSNQSNVPAGFQRREYQFNAGTNPHAFLKLTIEQN